MRKRNDKEDSSFEINHPPFFVILRDLTCQPPKTIQRSGGQKIAVSCVEIDLTEGSRPEFIFLGFL